MALNACSAVVGNTSALMLLAKVSHKAKCDVSGVGKYKPPADSEVRPSRRGSGPEADGEGHILCQGAETLSCGQGAATGGF